MTVCHVTRSNVQCYFTKTLLLRDIYCILTSASIHLHHVRLSYVIKGLKVSLTYLMSLWLIWKSISSAGMDVSKRLMVNYDTPRQCLNFNWTDFWYSSSFSVTWPSNLGWSTFGRRTLPLKSSRLAVPYRAHFYHHHHRSIHNVIQQCFLNLFAMVIFCSLWHEAEIISPV